jgi:hypothetical protein
MPRRRLLTRRTSGEFTGLAGGAAAWPIEGNQNLQRILSSRLSRSEFILEIVIEETLSSPRTGGAAGGNPTS